MDNAELIDAVERNGRALLAAAATDLDAQVAACPGWVVARLITHVGQVHAWMTATIEANSTERPSHAFVDPPSQDPVAWGTSILEHLVDVLRTTDPQRPTWTWTSERTVGWFARRMAHETVIHRWDVEQAVGTPAALDSDLAADGVDELISVGMVSSTNPKKVFRYPDGSLHLHRTDGEGEWLLRVEDGQLVATREHAKGDVAVRGSGSDLLLYLWGRSTEGLEIFGDGALAAEWAQVAP